ncbi:IS3 family transposase [Aminobacter carboxidus]|uniref:IS3 family transposase n=1 Tax=Aminobacter carboxidus TaxID=376165 RepID=A0ABR9GV48_9HYPH|nr:IS3 family transposase [Aminobacter carboxidus]
MSKGGSTLRTTAEKCTHVRRRRPRGLSVSEGCRLMGIARSTYYDKPKRAVDDTALVEAMHALKDEFEVYGWRRMQAALGQQGWVVNHKKLKRLMREQGLNARRRRRYVTTTDSDHDQPIFPDRTKDMIVDGPDQLWVADITYVAVAVGFVYVAVIMDAWSRRIIGYAMSRRIDARLTLAALDAAIALRQPPPGCVHHGDRGSQYAAEKYRDRLREARLVGSMGRRGNPYDNAMMESLMKTLKVEGVYPLDFETAEEVAEQLPAFIEKYNARRLHSSLGYLSPEQYEKQHARPPVKNAA